MGYGMKYTKGGFPFKASPAKALPKGMTGLTESEKKMKRAKLSSDVKSFVTGKKVDPDAPGTPGTPGYEPSVKRSDLDAKGKATWDKNHANKSKPKEGDMKKYSDLEKHDDDRSHANKSGSNRKVMKDGAKNNAIYKGKPVEGDFTPPQFQ